MTSYQTYAYCVFKTIGKIAVFVSQWSTLQAFVQATMWHNTEPKTLGISYWATGLFAGSICIPGFIYLITSLLFPATKSQSQRTGSGVLWLIRVTPGTALCVSSLPLLDNLPTARTVVLASGVVAINLYMILISWRPEGHGITDSSRPTVSGCSKGTCGPSFTRRTKNICQNSMTLGIVGNESLISVLATMAVRWCYGSTNVFYESWKLSLPLMLLAHTYGLVLFLWEQIIAKGGKFSVAFRTKFRVKNHNGRVTDNEVEAVVTSDVLPDQRVGENGDDISPTVEHRCNDKENGDVEVQDAAPLHSPLKEDTIFNSTAGDTTYRRTQCNGAPYLCAFFYTFLLSSASGSLAYLFLWVFTSPAIFSLWGEVPAYPWGYLVFTSFAIGCILAIFINVDTFHTVDGPQQYGSRDEKLQEKRLRRWQCAMNVLISIIVVLGTALILHTGQAKFLFGVSMFSLISPLLCRTVIVASHELVKASKSLQIPGKRGCINLVPATLLIASGITFVVFHILGVVFVNPQMTTIVHGRMGAILWPEVVLAVIPLICGPWIKNQIKLVDRLRSSSTGPLLAPETPNLAEKCYSDPDREWTFSGVEPERARKCRKTTQLLIIIFILITSAVVQYQSHRLKSSCDEALTVSRICNRGNVTSEYDLRVMTWNILLGHTMSGRSNLGAIARVTDEYDPHILAIQEATTHTPYWGGQDVFGYVQSYTRSCRREGKRVNPMKGTFETGTLSRFEIIDRSASVLPNGGIEKLPTYTMAKISCRVPSECSLGGEIGSGFEEAQARRPAVLHIYTLHAVYKNWTCSRHSRLSCEQMRTVHEDIRKLPMDEPVVVMGDFNINPSEPELDIWFQSDLGFKSALWPDRNETRKSFNYSCEKDPEWDDEACDCECRNTSSDPPNSTLLNRRAGVDHIFYRGLKLVGSAKILESVGDISDHYPVLADFVFD